jgi:hypothetical protein
VELKRLHGVTRSLLAQQSLESTVIAAENEIRRTLGYEEVVQVLTLAVVQLVRRAVVHPRFDQELARTRLKELWTASGCLATRAVGDQAGVSQMTVWNYLNGRGVMQWSTLYRIVLALNGDPQQFIDEPFQPEEE